MLGRSLDELPPQTRRLLTLIDGYVGVECQRQGMKRTDVHFSRRALREAIAWGDTQLRVHLERLVDLEYVLAHREGSGGKYVYELVYEVDSETRAQVAGLIGMEALEALASAQDSAPTTPKSRGDAPQVAGRLRGDSGPVAATSRGELSPGEPISMRFSKDMPEPDSKTHCSPPNGKSRSYPRAHAVTSLAAGA